MAMVGLPVLCFRCHKSHACIAGCSSLKAPCPSSLELECSSSFPTSLRYAFATCTTSNISTDKFYLQTSKWLTEREAAHITGHLHKGAPKRNAKNWDWGEISRKSYHNRFFCAKTTDASFSRHVQGPYFLFLLAFLVVLRHWCLGSWYGVAQDVSRCLSVYETARIDVARQPIVWPTWVSLAVPERISFKSLPLLLVSSCVSSAP